MMSRVAIGLCTLTLMSAPAAADREVGRGVFFSSCIACHSMACSRAGPKLDGIVGRRSGSVSGYQSYSEAMKRANIDWTVENLDAYLSNPAAFIPGNGMAGSAGALEDESERRDLIDFLIEPDSSVDLC